MITEPSPDHLQIDSEYWKKESKWRKQVISDIVTLYTLDITCYEDKE